jgi:hypothetical protein
VYYISFSAILQPKLHFSQVFIPASARYGVL